MTPSGTNRDLLRIASQIRKKKDFKASLDAAERRQRVMLPKAPSLPGYEFASTYDPASTISGDFYDYVHLPDERTGILIGDVSGHGVEAAIVMGMAKKSLSIFARGARGPASALARGNDDLCGDLDSETFLTAIYAVLDGATGRMVLARAGHPQPVLFNRKRTPPGQVVKSGGMMVGMSPGKMFSQALEEVTIDLVVGDLVFFYTDGLTEARNRSKEMFGLEGALKVIESRARSPAQEEPGRLGELLEAVRESLARFRDGTEPDDDVTMIAFRRTR